MPATLLQELTAQVPASCPLQAREAAAALTAEEELGFPNHKRLMVEYLTDASGARELHLYYGEKEVVFDAPELFAFGEALAKQARFAAGTAATWCDAVDWPRACELLEHLLEEGILQRATDLALEQSGARPAPLPPAQCQVPRTWFECEAIARELTGQSLELGYLELVVPIYRVAHIFLDGEGRQVGEANVFPQQLRLDIPTDWRVCPHAGSRYRDALPMNVTALKSMRAHWQQTMLVLSRIRAAFLQRFPHIVSNRWTVGDLERLASLVLTVPAYQLMRMPNPVPNGELHPVLSAMYRVTDGVRLTMHHMLFIPTNEATRPAETPMSAAELYSYAERNAVFLSEYGVCAGPGALIEEFLRVLIDGEAVPGTDSYALDPPVAAALQEIEAAFDYGLYGLQAHAVTFSLWSTVARTYERAWQLVQTWPSIGPAAYVRFRTQLQHHAELIANRSHVGSEASRSSRDRAFANMFDNCALALGPRSSAASLAACLQPADDPQHAAAALTLQILLEQRLHGANVTNDGIAELTAILMECLRCEQRVVEAAAQIAQRINTLLRRPAPTRALTVADIRRFVPLDAAQRRATLPTTDLEETLGVRIEVCATAITVAPLDGSAIQRGTRAAEDTLQSQDFGTSPPAQPANCHTNTVSEGLTRSTCDGHGTKADSWEKHHEGQEQSACRPSGNLHHLHLSI